jgi:hypothetical protein
VKKNENKADGNGMRGVVLKVIFVVLVFVVAGNLAIERLNKTLAKHYGRTDLEQSATYPSAWRPHVLNTTYGEGGSPESLRFNHTHTKQGFKYPREIEVDKPRKTVRIFGMGGSTLYGWGSEGLARYGNHHHLANDQTITYFLEKNLNEAVKKSHPDWRVEVINAAIIDYNSAFHLVYYNQVIWRFQPDIIFFLDGNNEFFGIKPFNTFADYKNSGVNVVDGFNNRGKFFSLYVSSRYLAKFSQAFKTIQYEVMNKWLELEAPTINQIYELPENFRNFERDYDTRAQLYLRVYSQILAAAKFDHVSVFLFLGPQMMTENEHLLGERDLRTRRAVLKDWGSPAGRVDRTEFMNRVRTRLPAYFKSIDFPYHDISALGSTENKHKALYIDYCHVTEQGAEVVAGKIQKNIEDRVLEIVSSEDIADGN